MKKKNRQLWFSVTAKDCDFQMYRGTGKGGQKKNKTSSAVRCSHAASGAVGVCEDFREQSRNKKEAFKRMAESVEFQVWLKLKISAGLGEVEIKEGDLPPRKLSMEEV